MGDFADYFGSRWHYYLGAIIASIPVPLLFGKGQFESGVAAMMLREFAHDPFPYLDDAEKKMMIAAQEAQEAQINYGGKMTQGFSRLARRDAGEYPSWIFD